jgi:regulator of ribonuclease activity B
MRIDGVICFQHMREALDAAIALNEAGFEAEILWEAIDDYSDAAFMKVARDVVCDADVTTMAAHPALDAFHDQVEALVDPFSGWLEEWGFS